jgi:hypothetical protein
MVKNRDPAEVLRPEDVAGEMGLSATQIRNLMRLKRFDPPIGYAHRTKGRRYQYVIYRSMLDQYLHKGDTGPPAGREDVVATVAAMKAENEKLAAMFEASQRQTASLMGMLETMIKREVKG